MLRRGFAVFQKFHFVSPLENSFAEFLQGRPISPSTVSGFISETVPLIETVNDYVYVHRLATSNMRTFDPKTQETLIAAIGSIDLSKIATNPLSVLLNCSIEFEDFSIRERIISEILSRPESELKNSRVVSRLIRAMDTCSSDSEWMSILAHLVQEIDIRDLSLENMLSLIRSTRNSEDVIKRLSEIAPLLTPEESVAVLVEVVSHNPRSRIILSLLTDLKRNILASESLNPRLIARAITGLARIGALTAEFRGLVSKSNLSRLSEEEMSIVRLAVYTANPPTVDDEAFKFDPKFLPVLGRRKSVDSLINSYSGVAKTGELADQQLMDKMVEKIDPNGSFAERTMMIEMMLLSSNPIGPELDEYVSMEAERLRSDSFVVEVMRDLGVSELSQMSDSCPLVVLQKINDVVIDIDSYTNPITRVMRSKIAEKQGLKYRVIDPLSWVASEDKAEYIRNLCEGDFVFAYNISVQTGADIRHDPDQPKPPFFGYIRKLDLK